MLFNGNTVQFKVTGPFVRGERRDSFDEALRDMHIMFEVWLTELKFSYESHYVVVPQSYASMFTVVMYLEGGTVSSLEGTEVCDVALTHGYVTGEGMVEQDMQSSRALDVVQYFLEYGTYTYP